MEYPLCDQTVTVYRLREGAVERCVRPGCFFRREERVTEDREGLLPKHSFLLVQPGENPIYPGDRIYEGEGPAVSALQWVDFTPENVEGLVVVSAVRPMTWQGEICHYEAQ